MPEVYSNHAIYATSRNTTNKYKTHILHNISKGHTMRFLRKLLLFYVMLSILDTLFTVYLTHAGYIESNHGYKTSITEMELNPIVRYTIMQYGIDGIWIYKLIIVGIACLILPIIHKKRPKTSNSIAIIGIVFTLMAAVFGAYSHVVHSKIVIDKYNSELLLSDKVSARIR